MNISSYNKTIDFFPPPRYAAQSIDTRFLQVKTRNQRKQLSGSTVKVQNMLTFLTAKD